MMNNTQNLTDLTGYLTGYLTGKPRAVIGTLRGLRALTCAYVRNTLQHYCNTITKCGARTCVNVRQVRQVRQACNVYAGCGLDGVRVHPIKSINSYFK